MVWRREDYDWEVREKLVSFSLVNPKDSSSRQWVIDWTGSLHEPRMVVYQWSNRPDHDCVYCVNLRRAQDANLVFRQRCSDAINFYDNMPASALDNLVTFADEVMFERNTPTSTKPEATLGDSIDLRISSQPEELCTLNVRQAKVFLISSLMKQVLKSPNKSTMINDLIKNYSKKHAEKVDYFPVSHRDSETHALRDGNLERHEVSKTEDRVRWPMCFKYQGPGETFWTCGRKLHGITQEVKKQAEQRMNSRFIMYTSWHWRIPKGVDVKETLQNHTKKKLQKARDYLNSTMKHNYGKIVERYQEDEQYQMLMHEQGYTQSDMEEFDRTATDDRNYVATPAERA